MHPFAVAGVEPYASRLTDRFGRRSEGEGAKSWLPAKLKQKLSARLMASHWFARNVVIERWFLHSGQRALIAGEAR